MLRKAVALFLVCMGLAVCVSCGKATNHYVYAAIPAASQILAYREDPNSGALTPLDTSPFSAGPGVTSIVIHPSKQFFYAANSGEDDISLFTIASGGAITEVTPRTPTGTTPIVLVMDPAGSYLYAVNAESNDIWAYSINASSTPPGALTAVGAPIPLGLTPLNMVLAPSGNFLYVTGATEAFGLIEGFSVNAGALTLVNVWPTGGSPYGLALATNSTGSFLYTANVTVDSISEFSIATDGSLSELPGSPIEEAYTSPFALLVDNSDKYLYVANEGSGNLAAYTIASDGGLTLLSSSPFTTNAQPSLIASDPNGLYLFVGNQKSAAIESFSLATSDGTLSEVGSYAVGNTPTSIAVVP